MRDGLKTLKLMNVKETFFPSMHSFSSPSSPLQMSCDLLNFPLEDSRAANNSAAKAGEPKTALSNTYQLTCFFVSLSTHGTFTYFKACFPVCPSGIFDFLFPLYFPCYPFVTNIKVAWEMSPPTMRLIPQTASHAYGGYEKIKRSKEEMTHFLNSLWESELFTATYSTALAGLLMLCYQTSISVLHNRKARAPVLILPDSMSARYTVRGLLLQ